MYKRLQTLTLSALARSPFNVRGPILIKIDQIGLKLALVEKRLTCSLHRDLRTWSGCRTSSNYTCI